MADRDDMPRWAPVAPTDKQLEYVDQLQRRLHLTNPVLDQHCQATYGLDFRELCKGQVSHLLDELVTWESLPASLQRAKGQLDLFEVQP